MAGKKKTAKKRVAKKKTARKPAPVEEFKVERHWLNKREMAAALGISVQAFDRWGVKPVAQRHQFGEAFYSVRDVLDNRLEWQRKKLDQGNENLDAAELLLEQERARLALTLEQAEGQRLKNAEMRRELAPVEMLTWALSDLAGQVAPLLTPIPGEIKRRIPKISNAELHVMREIIANALNLCAEVKLDFDAYESDDEPPSH